VGIGYAMHAPSLMVVPTSRILVPVIVQSVRSQGTSILLVLTRDSVIFGCWHPGSLISVGTQGTRKPRISLRSSREPIGKRVPFTSPARTMLPSVTSYHRAFCIPRTATRGTCSTARTRSNAKGGSGCGSWEQGCRR
jgi:hypothetical protein